MKKRRFFLMVMLSFSCLIGSEAQKETSLENAFDWEGMNLKVSPSEDFYQYAVGSWLAKVKIPEGHPRWGSFNEISQNNVNKIQSLFDDGFIPKTKEEKILYNFYHSFLNTKIQEEKGLKPLAKLLKKIDKTKTRQDLVELMGQLNKKGFSAVFTLGVGSHPYDSKKNILYLGQAKLNLPDYEIYLEKFDTDANKHKEQRQAYLSYVEKILVLSGYKKALAKQTAQRIFQLEQKFAEGFYTKEEAREIKLRTNLYTQEKLKKELPFSYDKFFSQMGISPQEINVVNPKLLANLINEIENGDIEVIKDYIRFTCINSVADSLGKKFYDAHFQLYSKNLYGINTPKPIKERAIESASNLLTDPLGKVYVSRFFPSEKKAEVSEMVALIKQAFIKKIGELTWLEQSTKKKAVEKLQNMIVLIGYPDEGHWVDFSSLTTIKKRKPLAANLLDIFAFQAKVELDKIGKPVDPYEWQMGAQEVNACNVLTQNKIIFPAGILQSPFFSEDPAISWGAFGMVISHEIIHSFDDQGRQFDLKGNQENWWQKKDLLSFEAHAKVIKDQFDQYTLTFQDGSKERVRGQLCLGENIADLGGLTIAFSAFKEYQKTHTVPTIRGFTPDQRFFLGCAQIFRIKKTESYSKLMLNNDPHSPAVWRINGPFSQMPEFREAFQLPAECPMVISEDMRSRMWTN